MITFTANYISGTKVYKNTKKKEKETEVSFVELNPKSKSDVNAVQKTIDLWGEDAKYADCIQRDIKNCNNSLVFAGENYESLYSFYAITTQKRNFNFLQPKKILSLAEVKKLNSDTRELKFIQVEPKSTFIERKENPTEKGTFSRLGTAMLNCLKSKYYGNKIILTADATATGFYEKNGFKRCDDKKTRFSFEEYI